MAWTVSIPGMRRVLIDARTLGPRPSGIGRYTLNLLRGLAQTDGDERISAWVRAGMELPHEVTHSDRVELIEREGLPAGVSQQLVSPRELRRLGVGLVHVPDAFAPLWSPCPAVVTVHDVIPLVMPEALPRSWKGKFPGAWRRWLSWQTRRAAAVVTVSEHAAGDLRARLGIPGVPGVPGDRVCVIPNAVPAVGGGGEAGDEALLEALGVSGRFLLTLGRRDPYKNVDGLVRAFGVLRDQLSKAGGQLPGAGVRLVVAGAADPRYPEAEREAARLDLGESVVFTGYVDEATRGALLRRAAAVVVPSRYEGFGLPAAEAMAAGTAVVAARTGALPETVGDAAEQFEADDEAGFVAALRRVLEDGDRRRVLIERGRVRA
ncbi:MAG: glycosyltransferase family 1 protein, partial [Planctomycetota bacterium]